MKKSLNKKFFIINAILITILILVINLATQKKPSYQTNSISIKRVGSEILADGKVASENEANLHFQTGGKLTYLAAKEGDIVYLGQTIANLDTYALQRQLTAALNTYRSTRDTFDQSKDNADSGVLAGQQKYNLEVPNKAGIVGEKETNIINDMIKRIVDQNQANLDNSVINVELANYALQLSSLTAPFNGIIVHEDVNVAGQNITPAASFMIIDPNALVFRATVNEQDIDYIKIGSSATVVLNGDNQQYLGTVTKIYPEKITLPTGQNIYKVDVSIPDLNAQYAKAGSVKIKSNLQNDVLLVPTWLVLNNQNIWIKEDNKIILKNVSVGKRHGEFIEILNGISSNDQIIESPESIIKSKYNLL